VLESSGLDGSLARNGGGIVADDRTAHRGHPAVARLVMTSAIRRSIGRLELWAWHA
jgi:hypothetical protein